MSNQSSRGGPFERLPRKQSRPLRMRSAAILAAGMICVSGCTGNVIRQGHQFQEEDLNQIREGMGKDQVVLALGTPDTQSAANGGSYYYISQTASQPLPFMKPEVTDRHVVAIYFNNKDRVQQIANYGLKDGKLFDFVKRETPTYTHDQGILKELFRNIGAAPALPGGLGRTPGG